MHWTHFTLNVLVVFSGLSIRAQNPESVSEEREDNMGSSSSSYGPKAIYLDVDGKVQKVGPIPVEMFELFFLKHSLVSFCFYCLHF